MKKKYILLVVALFVFFAFYGNVFAENKVNIINTGNGNSGCSGLFTKDALDIISDILNWFRILAPVLMILLTAVDIAKVVISGDPNAATTKVTSRIIKRAVAVVLVFFIPTIVRIILNLKGVRSAIQIPDDPLCGTMSGYPIEEIVY